MAQIDGMPITVEELRAAAVLRDPQYQGALVLLALAQILESVQVMQEQCAEFKCHGGYCIYE
jgi:hypothetical protein